LNYSELLERLNRTCRSTTHESTVARIIAAMVENDLLDLVARVLFILEPPEDSVSAEFGKLFLPSFSFDRSDIKVIFLEFKARNGGFFTVMESMFMKLAKVAPRQLLESQFRPYVPDWIKCRNHMILLYDLDTTLSFRGYHYDACYRLWFQAAKLLEQETNIMQADSGWLGIGFSCVYARCPDSGLPVLRSPGGVCGGCCKRLYCSAACQARQVLKLDICSESYSG
jgi:hypothetical protein